MNKLPYMCWSGSTVSFTTSRGKIHRLLLINPRYLTFKKGINFPVTPYPVVEVSESGIKFEEANGSHRTGVEGIDYLSRFEEK